MTPLRAFFVSLLSLGWVAMCVSDASALTGDSGIEGTTASVVLSGARGGRNTGGPAGIEFAVAPVEDGKPIYDRAVFVRSDDNGKYRVVLPPGTYWVGPKPKAQDPAHYRPGAMVVRELSVAVHEGRFTRVDVSEVGAAP